MSEYYVDGRFTQSELFVIVPQVFISIISWAQLILSLNRFTSVRNFTRIDIFGLFLFLLGGGLRWISALAVRTHSLPFQICCAALGTLIKTTAFIIIYNCEMTLPTKQQVIALLLSAVITSLWEVQTRLVFSLDDDE
jgi:hypothetical protein